MNTKKYNDNAKIDEPIENRLGRSYERAELDD